MTHNFTQSLARLGSDPPPIRYERRRHTIILPKQSQHPPVALNEEGRPLRRCWIGPTDELPNGLGFIPLAPSALVVALSFFLYGAYNIYEVVADDVISWDEAGDIVVATFKITVGLVSAIGIFFRWVLGVHVLLVGYNVLLASSCVNFVIKWTEWIMASNGYHSVDENGAVWEPTAEDRRFFIYYTLMFVFILTTPFWMAGVLHSLKMVFAVGGSGWENKNYLEIRWERQRRREHINNEQQHLALLKKAQQPPHKRVYSWLASLRRSSRMGSRVQFSGNLTDCDRNTVSDDAIV